MNHRRMSSFIVVILVLLMTLSGCAPAAAPAAGTAPAADQPVAAPAASDSGGQVVLIIPEEPATLNQYLAVAAIVRQVADATTAGLTTVDENGDFQPVLAAELPSLANGGVSEDFLTITWKLRPDLKWSDGTPLTSDDIKFTWEANANPDSGAVLSLGFETIDAIDTPDAQTAVVHYSTVNQAYLMQFAFGLLPRHATGAPADMVNWEWNRAPVTAGPFVVSNWESGSSITMDRNPNYYLEGQPYLDRIIFQVIPDASAQMATMMQGEGQVQLWPGAETKEIYDAQVAGVASLQEIPGPWNMALFFNLSKPYDDDPGPTPPHPILGDLRVRQAIAHAIDYDTIINDINPGVSPATSPFAYGWYRCDLPRVYPFDVAAANQLLDEAGWVMGDDGIRVAKGAMYAEDGTRLTLQMEGYTSFQPLQKLEEAIVEMMKVVGAEFTIQNDDFSIIFGSYADGSPRKVGNFDMLIYDSRLDVEPHATIANSFLSTAIPSEENPAGANASRWVNAEADAAIEAAGATVDVATRKAAYCDLGNLIATDLPRIHLYLFTEGYGASDKLSGYTVNMWGSLSWDVQNWKMSK